MNTQNHDAIHRLRGRVDHVLALHSRLLKQPPDLSYHAVANSIFGLSFAVLQCHKTGIPKEQIKNTLSPVYPLMSASPFVKRLQSRPRGYVGDYETIEYLCDAQNQSPRNTFAYFAEEYFILCPISQLHRNKIRHQARIILETLSRTTGAAANILSIGCGGSRDIHSIANLIANPNARFVLNDMDVEAIAFSKQRLNALPNRCHFVAGNVIRKLSQLEQLGPYDLVLAGGLFDYLCDEVIVYLMKNIVTKFLKPGGKLFFTNLAVGNPFKVFMEYFGDWSLVERSERDIFNLLTATGVIYREGVCITRDETGLALLVEARHR